MPYLIDSSCLIQAKNEYYDFDFHPGFWAWLLQANKEGKVSSIEQIRDEIEKGSDTCPLKIWSKNNKTTFFLPLDTGAMTAMTAVATCVNAGDYTSSAKRDFLGCADPFLIAFALSHTYTVVSHEVHKPGQKSKVKIPTICAALNVPCVRTFHMLKSEKALFISKPPEAI